MLKVAYGTQGDASRPTLVGLAAPQIGISKRIVNRAARVTVKAYDHKGRAFIWEFEGFPAQVAQHEVDHLNGIRFPDRITDDSKLHWVEEDEFGVYREQWRKWTTLCSRSHWEEIESLPSTG